MCPSQHSLLVCLSSVFSLIKTTTEQMNTAPAYTAAGKKKKQKKKAFKRLSFTRYYIKPSSILRHRKIMQVAKSCFFHRFNVQNDHTSYFRSMCKNYLRSYESNLPKFRKTNPLIQIIKKEGNAFSSVLQSPQLAS